MSADEPPGSGPRRDLARQLLAQRRGDARQRGTRPDGVGSEIPPSGHYSGPRPDGRDPQGLAASLCTLVEARGWAETVRTVRISACWDQLVGSAIAAHCRPARLVDGLLTVVAESTAWATQLRLLAGRLTERLAGELGPGLVRAVRVVGPSAPSWRHGRLRVPGPGPRDTYG